MTPSPWISLFLAGIALYLFRLWWMDYRATRTGNPPPGAFPGATAARASWLGVAALGGLALVALETGGEYALGVVDQQTTVTPLALLGFIAAGFYEELFFRGFVYYERRGRIARDVSIVGASLVFALLHYQYYIDNTESGRELLMTSKSAWSLLLLFVSSLWFYYLRFSRHNPTRSLLPCFTAHIVSNIAVFAVKALQGFVAY